MTALLVVGGCFVAALLAMTEKGSGMTVREFFSVFSVSSVVKIFSVLICLIGTVETAIN
jgi:hypothetical protein